MHKKNTRSFFSLLLAVLVVAGGITALTPFVGASIITPTLSVSGTGNNDLVQITVTGERDANVVLSYTKSGAGLQMVFLGSTDQYGYFSRTVSSSQYGVVSQSMVYVTVGGVRSPDAQWPYTSYQSGTTFSLSKTNVVLTLGQTTTITAYRTGSSYGSLYLASNTNASVANVSMSGNTITVRGNAIGSSVATVCVTGYANDCASIYITVENYGSQSLTFSTNTITLITGQSSSVSVSGGNGGYYVSGNSNPQVVQTSMSGSTVTLLGKTTGSSIVTVCSSSGRCGSLSVTVYYSSGGGTVYLSQSASTLGIGQTVNITISGGTQPYTLQNASTNIVQANVNGNMLTVYAMNGGTTYVDVCGQTGGCARVTITVQGTGYPYPYPSSLYLSPSTLSLQTGQSATVSVSGGGGSYYVSESTAGNIASVQITGGTATVYALQTGSTTVTICSSGDGCATLSISVSAPTYGSSYYGGSGYYPMSSSYMFTRYLSYGSSGSEVQALQETLTARGYYSGPMDGYYGVETGAAVQRFQTAYGIEPLGIVGPKTRNALNGSVVAGQNYYETTSATYYGGGGYSGYSGYGGSVQAQIIDIIGLIRELQGQLYK